MGLTKQLPSRGITYMSVGSAGYRASKSIWSFCSCHQSSSVLQDTVSEMAKDIKSKRTGAAAASANELYQFMNKVCAQSMAVCMCLCTQLVKGCRCIYQHNKQHVLQVDVGHIHISSALDKVVEALYRHARAANSSPASSNHMHGWYAVGHAGPRGRAH